MNILIRTLFKSGLIRDRDLASDAWKSHVLRVTDTVDGARASGSGRRILTSTRSDADGSSGIVEADIVAAHRRIESHLHACYDPILTEEIPPRLLQGLRSHADISKDTEGRIVPRGVLVIPRMQALAACLAICALSVLIGWRMAEVLSPDAIQTAPVAATSSGTEAVAGAPHADSVPEPILQETSSVYPKANGIERRTIPTQQTADTTPEIGIPTGNLSRPAPILAATGDAPPQIMEN